ncbi:MAG: hypothetical protein JNK89_04320, partial [Saprospiraceae bacterium]|nr:hypothetical protein [Saprospiraceae bacterium]
MSKLPKTNTGITHQHHTMRSIFHPTTTFFCLLFSTALYPQTASLFEQLTAATAPQLSLTTDVSALIANKKSDTYQPGALASSAGQTFAVEVKPRGKFRRRVSEIPPLKIKVKKKLLAEAGLTDSLNELKLVLPTSLDAAGDERVVREYLAYRLYEQLSPYAVRARLINLYLVNTDLQGQSHYQVKAILLEDEEETAARLGGEMLELFGMSADKLPADHTALMVMFQ